MACAPSIIFVKDAMDKKTWTGPVIDLGAGEQSKYYRPYFSGHEYIQLDLEAQPDGSTNIIADMLNMPQVQSSFYGVVLMLEILEHVAIPFLAFKEAARILRPGGLLICTTISAWPIHRHPVDYWRFTPDGLAYLCRLAKLTPFLWSNQSSDGAVLVHCCIAAIKE